MFKFNKNVRDQNKIINKEISYLIEYLLKRLKDNNYNKSPVESKDYIIQATNTRRNI